MNHKKVDSNVIDESSKCYVIHPIIDELVRETPVGTQIRLI